MRRRSVVGWIVAGIVVVGTALAAASCRAGASATASASTATPAPRPTLPPLATGLTGRLVQNGRGLADAEVRVHPRRDEGCVATARTDAAGHFVVEVPPGTYELRLPDTSPRGMVFPGVQVTQDEQHALGDLVVPAPAKVHGRAVDEAGTPLADVAVTGWWSELQGREPAEYEHSRTRTDADGRFTLDSLRSGDVSVRAEHPTLHHGFRALQLDAGSTVDAGDFVLKRVPPLTGVVVDAQGRPVGGAVVMPGGGPSEDVRRDRAVRTQADGSFVLLGFGGWDSLSVEKDGLAPTVVERIAPEPRRVRVRMQPNNPVAGRVLGNDGHTGVLRVIRTSGEQRRWPRLFQESFERTYPVAADGTFSIPHLPAGSWLLSIDVPGKGSVPPREVEVPLVAPLEWFVVPPRSVELTVVDERGAPVPHASVRIVEPEHVRTSFVADQDGIARFAAPAGVRVHLVASAPRYREGEGALWPADASEHEGVRQMVVRVRRGGVIRGRVLDASLRRHLLMTAYVRRADSQSGSQHKLSVDAEGRFVSPPMSPGRYRVTLSVVDPTPIVDLRLAVPDPVCLLRGNDSSDPDVEVDVPAGGEVLLELPAPEVGVLECRVTAAGKAVPHAIVRGTVVGKYVPDPEEPERRTARHDGQHMVADAEGRCRFFVVGRSPIRMGVALPSSPAWSAPFPVEPVAPGETRTIELSLRAAKILGSLDVASLTPAARAASEMQLYPLDAAGADPFAIWHRGLPREADSRRTSIHTTGRFAYEGLPPGAWVLRLVVQQQILWQRVLTIVGDEVHDLGRIEPPARVTPQLSCGVTAPHHAVEWRSTVDGKDGIFVTTAYHDGQGQWTWPDVPPGHYELRLLRFDDPIYVLQGAPGAPTIAITVHDDGSTSPASIWPDGH
jgi:hypothetical protein